MRRGDRTIASRPLSGLRLGITLMVLCAAAMFSCASRSAIAADTCHRQAFEGTAYIVCSFDPTVAGLRQRHVGSLATAAFNRRLQEAAKRGEVSYQGGIAYDSDLVSTLRTTQVQASGDPAKWKSILNDIARILQQARQYSLSKSEIDLARKDLLA